MNNEGKWGISLNLGDVLVLIAAVVSTMTAWGFYGSRLTVLENRIESMENNGLNPVVVAGEIATIEAKMSSLDQTYEDVYKHDRAIIEIERDIKDLKEDLDKPRNTK